MNETTKARLHWVLLAGWLAWMACASFLMEPNVIMLNVALAFVFALRNGLLAKGHGLILSLAWFASGMVASIGSFAGLYHKVGLLGPENTSVTEAVDAVYFSVVTWTTLGYGDIRPTEGARLYAAGESLLGYAYMAIALGLVAGWLGKSKNG